MRGFGALLGVAAAAALSVAVIYWRSGEDQSMRRPASSAVASADAAPAPTDSLPSASNAPSPKVATSASPGPLSDAGAATLSQRLESNRLLKEAREADGVRQLDLYENALKANPGNVDALMELGQLRLNNEDWEDAEALAKRCLKLDKHRLGCRQTLEWRYTRTGDFESAEELYEGCLEETFVRSGCLAFNIGSALRAGDVSKAKQLHARLAAFAPKSVDAIISEAAIAREEGDEAAARAAYDRGCKLGNEFACTWLAQHPRQ